MNRQFKWWCCRYLLRIICVDCSFSDKAACVFHRCRDGTYKPDRPGLTCEEGACMNPRRKHGIPTTVQKYYV